MNREAIRTWQSGRFKVKLFDTGRTDWRGQSRLAYTFTDGDKVIFAGEDFAGSPMHADDSGATLAALLGFLALRPGDTDREYFDSYTPEQLEWSRANGEELAWLAHEIEERARRGMVSCSVETHFTAWLVTFDDGATLLLQSDYDQAAFAVHCGAIEAPDDWDGLPSRLGDAWTSFDPSTIDACPDDYRDAADAAESEVAP